jgi:uncharacterized protein
MTEEKLPLPPFIGETAAQKVRAAADAWNTRDPEMVGVACATHLLASAEWSSPQTGDLIPSALTRCSLREAVGRE